jgi:hypothetical protein
MEIITKIVLQLSVSCLQPRSFKFIYHTQRGKVSRSLTPNLLHQGDYGEKGNE